MTAATFGSMHAIRCLQAATSATGASAPKTQELADKTQELPPKTQG